MLDLGNALTSLFINKILPVFVLPLGLGLLLILLGLVFRRRWLAVVGLLGLWGFSLPVVANFLLAVQEGREGRVPVERLERADAVVVLGGMILEVPVAPLGEWGSAVDRFEAGVELWQAGKAPYLVFTGGWVPWRPTARPEGEILRERARRRGVPDPALLVTAGVGNTAAEALAVFELLYKEQAVAAGRGAPRIVLVTSAFHLPRATGLFERAGLEVQGYPVDFYRDAATRLAPHDFLPSAEALRNSEMVLREWLGIAFYRVTGKI